MNYERLNELIERLRKEAIGEPQWIAEKEAFEYGEQSPKVVAVLKLVRAAHGVTALRLLCEAGLIIDFGAIMRCVNDCTEEIYFLLEDNAEVRGQVEKFVRAFFESTIDGYLTSDAPPVSTKKIRSAVVRVLKGENNDETRERLGRIYKTFCGYVHADYAHIMEVYNGRTEDFNLSGVPSDRKREVSAQFVELTANSVLHAAAFMAQVFGLKGVHSMCLDMLD